MASLLYILLCFLLFLISGFILLYFLVLNRLPFKVVYNTFRRDFKAFILYIRIILFLKKCQYQNQSVVDLFHRNVAKYPNKVCFVFEDEEWTYKQVNDLSNKIAHCFRLQEYKKGDEVALFMENCPDYVCFWLGLAKIGVVTALINANQKADSLAYSINVINTKGIIVGQSLTESLQKAMPLLDKKDVINYYCYSRNAEEKKCMSHSFKNLNALLDDVSSAPLDPKRFQTNFTDKLIYIYTSGTTGFPKAAVFTHSRFMAICCTPHFVAELNEFDTFYNPLPMYHTAGGILFLGGVLIFGGKMVLRKKFSASNFWKEVVKHKVTVCQYIGEICRYLLNQPKVPEETQHSVHLIFGNGLRPHIWKEFKERYKMPRIMEMYGATEGNANLVNIFGKEGAVGFVSRILPQVYPVCLIRVNPETGELIRDKDGLCLRCKPGEPGEMVGKVVYDNPLNAFHGYANSSETKKKIVRDCFQKGDTAFLTGDLLVMDDDGYIYFLDRTGDTYRWKGENVSTNEVENIISKILNFTSCVVYGVEIPGTEGRAGMATIQEDPNKIDFENFYKSVNEKLPSYAVPVILRLCSDIEATGTFKLRKVNLQKEGYNPEEIPDPLYFLDNKNHTYFPLTKEIYSNIINGRIRL